jgi:hypothetical protein
MTIQVELNPDLEQRLTAEAQAQGIALETFAQRILQDAIGAKSRAHSRARQEEFRVFLDALASRAPHAPHLDSESFLREMIYSEHD